MICIFVFLLPYMTIHVRQIYQHVAEIRFDFWKKSHCDIENFNRTDGTNKRKHKVYADEWTHLV